MKTKTLISILLFAFEIAQKIDIKVKPIPIFLLIFLTLHSNGQPISHWAKTYGGSSSEVNSTVLVTSDNCYLLTGETKSFGSGGYDIWLVKTKQNGDTLWTRTFGGGKNEYCYSAQETMDHGFIITGSTKSFGAGAEDVWLLKTDSSGDSVWSKTFGGISYDAGYYIQQTSDKGYIIAGYTESFGAGNWDVWLIKTDTNGDTLWTKTFGGEKDDYGHCVQQSIDGGFIITGAISSSGYGNWDIWLLRTDTNGDTLWTKTFGDSNYEYGNSVLQTNDNGYIITGPTNSFGNGDYDFWLVKTDSLGETLWSRTYGGNLDDKSTSCQQTSDGGYIITGYTESFGAGNWDVWLIKTDINGDTLWTKTFGGSSNEFGESVKQAFNGGYILSGYTYSFGNGDYDFWLISLDSLVTPINWDVSIIPTDFMLFQNYPNPFNPTTTIRYDLPKSSKVTLTIYNNLGQEVITLIQEQQTAGEKSVVWDGKDNLGKQVSSGVYFYQLKAGNFLESRKMVLIR